MYKTLLELDFSFSEKTWNSIGEFVHGFPTELDQKYVYMELKKITKMIKNDLCGFLDEKGRLQTYSSLTEEIKEENVVFIPDLSEKGLLYTGTPDLFRFIVYNKKYDFNITRI